MKKKKLVKKVRELEEEVDALTDYVFLKLREKQHEIDLQNPFLKDTITQDANIPCSTDSITFEDVDQIWKSLIGKNGMTEDEKEFWKWFSAPQMLGWGYDNKGTHVTYTWSWPFSCKAFKKDKDENERNS